MGTLEGRYQTRLRAFEQEKEGLGGKKDLIASLEARLALTSRDAEPKEYFEVSDRLEALKREVAHVESGEDEIQFIFSAIPFISEYTSAAEEQQAVPPPKPPSKPKSKKATTDHTQHVLDEFVSVTGRCNKNHILQRYMVHVEKQTDNIDVSVITEVGPNAYVCPDCPDEQSMVLDAGRSQLICPQCGRSETHTEMQLVSYEAQQSSEITTVYSYSRTSHFLDWLHSVAGNETSQVPPDVVDRVAEEYRKQRTSSKLAITPEKTRQFLKKLGLSRYYENCYTITRMLKGGQSDQPRLSKQQETTLIAMFNEIQPVFEVVVKKVCPQRKNFLSYSYCLHKCCQLMGWDELLVLFPLLKSSEKLYVQEKLWRGICQDLQWEFISSM